MNYAAPELSTQPGNFTCASDMWSLGCIVWELFSIGQEADGTTRKLVQVEDGNPLTHAYKVQNIHPIAMDRIPQMLQSSLNSLLSVNPGQRASATALKDCPYFTRGPVQTMHQLDNLLQMDEENQKAMLKDLLPALSPFPDYLLETMVLPKLEEVSLRRKVELMCSSAISRTSRPSFSPAYYILQSVSSQRYSTLESQRLSSRWWC